MKWLWSDMKMNCSAGFKNVDWTRAVILVKIGRLNVKWKGVDETHFFWIRNIKGISQGGKRILNFSR